LMELMLASWLLQTYALRQGWLVFATWEPWVFFPRFEKHHGGSVEHWALSFLLADYNNGTSRMNSLEQGYIM
jgi:hypothetical protein